MLLTFYRCLTKTKEHPVKVFSLLNLNQRLDDTSSEPLLESDEQRIPSLSFFLLPPYVQHVGLEV